MSRFFNQKSSLSWEEAVLWLRKQPDQEELVQACYYDDPLLESAERFYQSTEWQAVQEILADMNSGRALDIGAGRGISSYALAEDGWKVTALEPDPSPHVGGDAIREIAAAGYDISVAEGIAEQMPFEANSFDLVYGRAVLHHAGDLEQLCREVFRVLKPGGRFLFTREHVISRKEDLPGFLAAHPLHKLYGGENAFLLAQYTDNLRNAGLALTRFFAPWSSDINLFPASMSDYKKRIRVKTRLPVPDFLFKKVIAPLLNIRDRTPGRLYSFTGFKP